MIMKKTIIIFGTAALVIAAVAYGLSARSQESDSDGREKFADAAELYDCGMTVGYGEPDYGEPFEARMPGFSTYLLG